MAPPQGRRSASTGCCSAPTSPTPRACPTRRHFVKDIPDLRRRTRPGRSCATTCATCSAWRPDRLVGHRHGGRGPTLGSSSSRRPPLRRARAARRPWCGPRSTATPAPSRSRRSGTTWPALGWLGLAVAEADGGRGLRLRRAGRRARGAGPLGRARPDAPDGVGGRRRRPADAASPADAGAARRPRRRPPRRRRGPDRRRSTGGDAGGRRRRRRRRASGCASGTVGPVLCGALADVVIVPVTVDGEERVVRSSAATTAHRHRGRRRSTPPAAAGPAGAGRRARPLLPPGSTGPRSRRVGVALAAAEAAGGAAWCVDTAAAYARDRRQFGRPIGQFQAVKHRCADMLVRLEQARARGVGRGRRPSTATTPTGADAGLARRRRRRRSPSTPFVDVAKDCIQVLGGIGFTWEHDAHLYLRRALALRQLFGGAGALAARGGGPRRARRHPAPPPARPAARRPRRSGPTSRATVEAIAALPKDERRRPLADAGLIVPHWAPPWGRDAGAVEQLVIDQELRRARVRVPHLMVGAWAAPTIAAHGTPEQQERWVRPTLHGEITWCQLFSEPEAGSRPGRRSPPAATAHRRRLAAQRPEGVDDDGRRGRLGHLPGPHQPGGAQAPRHHLLRRRHVGRRASTSARCAS